MSIDRLLFEEFNVWQDNVSRRTHIFKFIVNIKKNYKRYLKDLYTIINNET